MKTPPIRSFLLALALAAFALPSVAAPTPTKISSASIATFHNADDSVNNDWSGGGHGIGNFFDGNTTTGVYIGPNNRAANGCYVLLTFSESHFITSIKASSATTHKYSLYYSADGSSWTAIEGGVAVAKQGTTELSPNVEATYIKCVFDQIGGWTQTFSELEVWGYIPPKPIKISSSSIASFHNADDSVNSDWSGGGHGIGNFFDGNTTTGVYIGPNNRAANGCYLLLTFSQAYYITTIKASSATTHKYSLYYSADGSSWTAIEGGVAVAKQGTTELSPNVEATYIKCVFDQIGGWTQTFSELEVWGMDPADIACTHPTYTEWTRVANSATCTENAIDERFCTVCGERFVREVLLTALGHVYVATLTEPGTINAYGSGTVTCSREGCDFHIDFDGDTVDFAAYGGIPMAGVVQFMNLTTYSQGGTDGGISPKDLIDNVWDDGWNGYWFAEGISTNEWIQFSFGTPIELTKIEYSVLNQDQTVYFNKYDPATGEETLLRSIVIVKDMSEGAPNYQRRTVTFTREAEGGEGTEPAPTFDSAPTTDDSNASSITVDAIRMRIGDVLDPDTGEVVKAYVGIQYGRPYHTCVLEVHPYGTIVGAAKVDSGAKPAFLFMQ